MDKIGLIFQPPVFCLLGLSKFAVSLIALKLHTSIMQY